MHVIRKCLVMCGIVYCPPFVPLPILVVQEHLGILVGHKYLFHGKTSKSQ